MTGRRLSLEGGFHAIPQTPVLSNSVILREEEAEIYDARPSASLTLSGEVPTKVKYAYFMLGAAMLLGWNGGYPDSSLLSG
jgi:hypothetical protein